MIVAVVGRDSPGAVIELSLDDLSALENPLTTHDLSVAETLRLAQSLGELPSRLGIIGICMDPDRPLDDEKKISTAETLLARIDAWSQAQYRQSAKRRIG